MKKLIFILLLFPAFVFGQSGYSKSGIFATTDTLSSITSADSVYARMHNGPWQLLGECMNDTSYITAYNKTQEDTVIFIVSNESWWTYTDQLQIEIRSTNIDTIKSKPFLVGGMDGAVTIFITPDTSGTNTFYDGSFVKGK